MPKKVKTLVLLLLILSIDISCGKHANKTYKTIHKKKFNTTVKINNDRIKRSTNENEASIPWISKGLKIIPDRLGYDNELKDKISTNINAFRNIEVEPFWATRGRRDSSSGEDYSDADYSDIGYPKLGNIVCKGCPTPTNMNYRNAKVSRDEYSPFWGNRGRRGSEENEQPAVVFWGSRGRREDNEPFWGNRGRRQDELPFWAIKGRREDEPFWGNRGRRENIVSWKQISRHEDEPFWGNRGKREDTEPFWGNRGRREDSEPFWGNRGRREDSEPFWGNRGKKKDSEPFWGNRGRRKEQLKESILTAMDNVENDIKNLSRLRRSESAEVNPLKLLSSVPVMSKMFHAPNSETVHDSRIYAEQPQYILVERSSRSSAEEDPYFISRGKKYYLNYSLIKAARDRRGAIDEIVKSVRNDPYYIARGKKRREDIKPGSSIQREELKRVKELVCSAMDLITINHNTKEKREMYDNDRDRRQILKKLAAQLQMDPYFVSRGKKSDANAEKDYLYDFINDVAEKCDY